MKKFIVKISFALALFASLGGIAYAISAGDQLVPQRDPTNTFTQTTFVPLPASSGALTMDTSTNLPLYAAYGSGLIFDNVAKTVYVGSVPEASITNLSTDLGAKLSNITGFVTAGTNITLSGSGTIGSPYSISAGAAKRQETYSGTTNGSGVYTVTFGTSYAVAPNIQANLINGTDTQSTRITSVSTTGFTVLARNRTDVVGLLPAYANLTGASIDVLTTEK